MDVFTHHCTSIVFRYRYVCGGLPIVYVCVHLVCVMNVFGEECVRMYNQVSSDVWVE